MGKLGSQVALLIVALLVAGLLSAQNSLAANVADLGTVQPQARMKSIFCWAQRPGTSAVFEIRRGGTWQKLDSAKVIRGGDCDSDSPYGVVFQWSAPKSTGSYQLRTRYFGTHATSTQKALQRIRVARPTIEGAGTSAGAPSGPSSSSGLLGCTYMGTPL